MADADFAGTQRYEVLSRLGSGGMGVVYLVSDREHGGILALKSVGAVHGEALLRFKREFRAVQDLNHPNVVALGELFEESGRWYYTMEYVDGTSLMRHLRPNDEYLRPRTPSASAVEIADAPTAAPSTGGDTDDDGDDVTVAGSGSPASTRSIPPASSALGVDDGRLRRSMAQLAAGVAALHRANKVHRDLKPSNVMVTQSGRVVILDFGLVVESRRGMQESDVGIMGTYPYMSPEQLSGMPVDARSDWYSVGVILFQALTGRLPFQGRSFADVSQKLHYDAPAPSDLVDDVPGDLDVLCKALLRRDRDERPSQEAIFAALRVDEYVAPLSVSSSGMTSLGPTTFVGRKHELEVLSAEFSKILDHHSACVLLSGEAGVGKTEVVEHFVARVEREHPGVLVLRGRCFEKESVPYKSFDGIVDSLSSHLARLDEPSVRRLLPSHGALLARAFPVLRRIATFANETALDVADPQERRARIFAAMRSLLQRLAATGPVVVVLEDLQWLDDDSRSLLAEVMREPAAPALLLVVTRRGGAATANDARIEDLDGIRFRHLALSPLDETESRALATALLSSLGVPDEVRADAIARESRGHPLFVEELARYARAHRDAPMQLGLDEALRGRMALLADEDRRVLEALAVAGGPLPEVVLAGSVGISVRDLRGKIATLRSERWVRLSTSGHVDTLEVYHDRIASAAAERVEGEARRSLHERLGRELVAHGSKDFVQLTEHFRQAGDTHAAARYAHAGAEAAAEVLAFDRAAQLYRTSLALFPGADSGLERRRERLAIALANAGRGREAGAAFLEAVEGQSPMDAVDLRRRAAEQFLISGDVEKGVATFADVLRTLGVYFPRSILGTLVAIALVQLRLLFRGIRFRERAPSEADTLERLRVDAYVSAGRGLTPINPIKAFDFYGRALLFALELGDIGRIAANVAFDAASKLSVGPKPRERTFRLLFVARRLAERSGDPRARGVVAYAEGMARYMIGEWREAIRAYALAEKIFREECDDAPEVRTLAACISQCYWEAGDWRMFRSYTSRAIRESVERGDLFTEATFRAGVGMQASMMVDEGERAFEAAERVMASWVGLDFDAQRYLTWIHGSSFLSFRGDRDRAVARFEESWPLARRSVLFQVHIIRGGAMQIGTLVLLTRALDEGPDRARLLRRVRSLARSLHAEDTTWCRAAAYQAEATIAALQGRDEVAHARFDLALREYEAGGMAGRHAAVEWAKGAHLGGERGQALVDSGRSYFISQGVVRPAAFAATLAPLLRARDRLRIPPDEADL